jgi:predicted DNA-binding mobile mystery protein A
MKNQWLTINQVDRQLREWQAVKNKYGKPKVGWIKTLRTALGMSAEQLADRLGLTRGRVVQLETSESHNTVTLKTLNEAANALGCELVYAIVPKRNATLKDLIDKKAEQVSKDQVARVAHTMSLEAQTVDADSLKIQQEMLKENLKKQLGKKLWELPNNPNKLAKTVYEQLLKNNKITAVEKNLKNDPEFTKALQHALSRYAKNIKSRKKNEVLEKVIKNLKKKS